MKTAPLLLLFLFGSVTTALSQPSASIVPVELSCEYLINPTGIDIRKPRFSWKLSASDTAAFSQKQTAYRILVSSSLKRLHTGRGDIWNSGWVASDETQLIACNGKPLSSDDDYFWAVEVKDENGVSSGCSQPEQFSTGLFDEREWQARWIGTDEVYRSGQGDNQMYDPWFRKTFELKESPERAVLFVASVGYHEVYVNGKKIGDHVLAPAVTDHVSRARYLAYDIASALHPGRNVIALWLGASWSIFAPYATSDKPRTPLVIAQADIYNGRNHRTMRIVTDESWKTHPSPNKLIGNWSFRNFGGEVWDANKEIPDWNTARYDDGVWKNVRVYSPRLKLTAQEVETNALLDKIHPVSIEQRSDNSFRVDMGVNFAGWTQIKVTGNPGDTIHFLFSERRQDDMTFGLHNMYVIGPSGEGTFQNKFNYSSGRWITIKGLKYPPKKGILKGGWCEPITKTPRPSSVLIPCKTGYTTRLNGRFKIYHWVGMLWTARSANDVDMAATRMLLPKPAY